FKFLLWLEEMDYHGLAAILDKLKINRSWLYSILPILLALFMGLYSWVLARKSAQTSELEKLWLAFQSKLRGKGIELPLMSVSDGNAILRNEEESIQSIWQELIKVSFKDQEAPDMRQIKKRIDQL